MIKLAATGHRPNKLGGYWDSPLQQWLRVEMRRETLNAEPDEMISGMAIGIDTMFAQLALDLGVPLTCAVPFKGQEKVWPSASQRLYFEILERAYSVVYVSPGDYVRDRATASAQLQIRNKWMVKKCEKMLAVWDGTPGGTANCVSYAESVGRPIIRINPKDFK